MSPAHNEDDLRHMGYRMGRLSALVLTFLIQACSGPALKPWHSVDLREEFTEKQSQVETFDDYLALEKQLFAQLKERVLTRVPTKDRNRINRKPLDMKWPVNLYSLSHVALPFPSLVNDRLPLKPADVHQRHPNI